MIGELALCTILTATNIQEVCRPDVPFVWCERKIEFKSDTKPYQCKGGKGVSMHLYHHATGCNGEVAGEFNFFRGSKSENLIEWNRLEKLATPNAVTCSVIDATDFTITESNCHDPVDKNLCKGRLPLCGLGLIDYYKGVKKGEYCKVTEYIGSYLIDRDAVGNVVTSIMSDVGVVTYHNHVRQGLKKERNNANNKATKVNEEF